jgi:hypothetical protein
MGGGKKCRIKQETWETGKNNEESIQGEAEG